MTFSTLRGIHFEFINLTINQVEKHDKKNIRGLRQNHFYKGYANEST